MGLGRIKSVFLSSRETTAKQTPENIWQVPLFHQLVIVLLPSTAAESDTSSLPGASAQDAAG